jgi:DNA-directed RNA polymerase subunit RPC12/RpoP
MTQRYRCPICKAGEMEESSNNFGPGRTVRCNDCGFIGCTQED